MYPANVVVAVAVAEGGSLTATPVNVCKRGGMVVRECEVGVRMRRRRGEEISLDCDFDGPVVFGGVVAAGDDGGDGFILEVVFECVVVCWLVDCIFEDDMDCGDGESAELTGAHLQSSEQAPSYILSPRIPTHLSLWLYQGWLYQARQL